MSGLKGRAALIEPVWRDYSSPWAGSSKLAGVPGVVGTPEVTGTVAPRLAAAPPDSARLPLRCFQNNGDTRQDKNRANDVADTHAQKNRHRVLLLGTRSVIRG